jgi:hypothetical protein
MARRLNHMTEQTEFPGGPPWNVPGDLTGYTAPDRTGPVLETLPETGPLVTIIGTVRDERIALERSMEVWFGQHLPAWLEGRVEWLILDDGSSDDVTQTVLRWAYQEERPIRLSQWREDPTDQTERSCTLLFNAAIRHMVHSPLVMLQWYDRIPGSFRHLASLVEPHRQRAGIMTSAITRHIGGSSSIEAMTPDALAAHLRLIDWRNEPRQLENIAGTIGGHCIPGVATESSGLCIAVEELLAIGGYDEAYTTRASYANVELWRRLLQTGLTAVFPDEAYAQNFHQSHGANRVKDYGQLHDQRVVRNLNTDWGAIEPVVEW